ncbi:hypothetical protein D3C87_1388570 [compost metagenome]
MVLSKTRVEAEDCRVPEVPAVATTGASSFLHDHSTMAMRPMVMDFKINDFIFVTLKY